MSHREVVRSSSNSLNQHRSKMQSWRENTWNKKTCANTHTLICLKQLTLYAIMMCTNDLWINQWLKTKHIDRWILHVNDGDEMKRKKYKNTANNRMIGSRTLVRCAWIMSKNNTTFFSILRIHGLFVAIRLRAECCSWKVCFMLLLEQTNSDKWQTSIGRKTDAKKNGENNKRIKFYFFMSVTLFFFPLSVLFFFYFLCCCCLLSFVRLLWSKSFYIVILLRWWIYFSGAVQSLIRCCFGLFTQNKNQKKNKK